jgi:VCBS repeat-containing protein
MTTIEGRRAALAFAAGLLLAAGIAPRVLAAPPVPAAVDDTYSTPEDAQKVVSDTDGVLSNDESPGPGNMLCVASVDKSNLHGSLDWSADGSFTYTPPTNYNGAGTGNSFTYTMYEVAADASTCDAPHGSTGTVEITVTAVNDPPTAVADSFQALMNTTLNIGAPGVLSNDSDIDGDSLTAVKVNNPTHGVVVLASDGSFSYTPTTGFTGSDTFSYKASDGVAASATRVVTITVSSIPPIATPTPAPTPVPTVPLPQETLTPFLTPPPDATLEPGASPTEFVPPTPQLSGVPGLTGAPSLAPGATPTPGGGPTADGGDSTLLVVLVVGLLALLVGVGAAVYGPRWLESQRAGRR